MRSECTKVVYLTDELARKTAEVLKSFATARPAEGVVYWFGIESATSAVVTSLMVPDAESGSGYVRTSVQANAEVVSRIAGTRLVYIGQAHSHPGVNVEHSETDDVDTFACFDGVISVVVPWFGRYGFHLIDCGVYRHIGGQFRQIRNVDQHIQILPSFIDLRDSR
jgi:hypothetical protein